MKTFFARVRAVISRPRVMHYLDIFIAGTGTALYYNRDDLLGAHGLNLVGSIAFGACVAGLKAVIEAFRKSGAPRPRPLRRRQASSPAMDQELLEQPSPPDPWRVDRVEAWRLEQLLQAGYPIAIAEQLATRSEVDLHQAVELVTARGCVPELAGRILL